MNRSTKQAVFAAVSVAAFLLVASNVGVLSENDAQNPATGAALPVDESIPQQVIDSPIRPIQAQYIANDATLSLGRKLFHDVRLSSDNSVSCASCHDLDNGGVDGRVVAEGVGGRSGDINTPTVFNVGLNIAHYWDGRAETLEQQIDGPIHHPNEMASDWKQIIGKLQADSEYPSSFNELFPSGITSANIKHSLAQFQRSLLTTNAPFDRYLLGDANAISDTALKGYEYFKEYGCIACHQGSNVGGNVYQPIGVMADYFADRGTGIRQSDLGRYNVTEFELDKHVFRVPSLRVAALTAPYFHDGSVATLERAVQMMVKYQTGRVASKEIEDSIVAFLHSLVGEYEGKQLLP